MNIKNVHLNQIHLVVMEMKQEGSVRVGVYVTMTRGCVNVSQASMSLGVNISRYMNRY